MKRAAGGCLVLAMSLGAIWILFRIAPVGATLALWGGGAVWLWWAVSRPLPDTANPAPPPGEEPLSEEKPLVRVIRQDPTNPHRHTVEWVTDKEIET